MPTINCRGFPPKNLEMSSMPKLGKFLKSLQIKRTISIAITLIYSAFIILEELQSFIINLLVFSKIEFTIIVTVKITASLFPIFSFSIFLSIC